MCAATPGSGLRYAHPLYYKPYATMHNYMFLNDLRPQIESCQAVRYSSLCAMSRPSKEWQAPPRRNSTMGTRCAANHDMTERWRVIFCYPQATKAPAKKRHQNPSQVVLIEIRLLNELAPGARWPALFTRVF